MKIAEKSLEAFGEIYKKEFPQDQISEEELAIRARNFLNLYVSVYSTPMDKKNDEPDSLLESEPH